MTTQLERLNQDIVELKAYMKKLERRGNSSIVPKIARKVEYLQQHIAEKQLEMQ